VNLTSFENKRYETPGRFIAAKDKKFCMETPKKSSMHIGEEIRSFMHRPSYNGRLRVKKNLLKSTLGNSTEKYFNWKLQTSMKSLFY
jgi:hypothetical protein